MKETIYHLHALIHMSIALLTDLHNRPYQSIIDSLTVHRPDMICIAGDLIYSITSTEDISLSAFVKRPHQLRSNLSSASELIAGRLF